MKMAPHGLDNMFLAQTGQHPPPAKPLKGLGRRLFKDAESHHAEGVKEKTS